MANLSSAHARRLVLFIALVVGLLAIVYRINARIRDKESALAGGNARLRAALERLQRDPANLSMTMGPGLPDERQLRHVNAYLVPHADVVVLGQSDCDHVSASFFRPGVRFYNGFVSSSYLAYQYEVLEELADASGMPDLVLLDARSGYFLSEGPEPSWEQPADDPLWAWAGPPRSRGIVDPPLFHDVDSLLSLQQTELSARWLVARYAPRKASTRPTADEDSGAPYLTVSAAKASSAHRWLADGSRVYPGEVNGVLVPLYKPSLTDELGDRKVNRRRVDVLGEFLDKLRARNVDVIVYVPPILPRVFAQEPKQVDNVHALAAALRAVVEARGYDFCDVAADAEAIGCTVAEFYDEHHIGRGCSRKVMRHLAASGCAKHFGVVLAKKLRN